MRIERLTEAQASEAAALEQACLPTAWSERQLRSLPPEAVYLVALEEGRICGIGCLYGIGDEAELQNLAVLPAYRRRGVARALLQELLAEAARRGCACVFLEVAEQNAPAQALYARFGFLPVGRRRGFYRGEDAILMKCLLKELGKESRQDVVVGN